MDWSVRAFLKASLAWLAAGVTVGVATAAHPVWTVYRPVHEHMTLLGFVTMMIYGVAYHVIPRFAGLPLHNTRLPVWHWWASNVGLAGIVAGFALRVSGRSPPGISAAVLATGGSLAALGAYMFVYNVWRTLSGTPVPVSTPRVVIQPRTRSTVPPAPGDVAG